MRDGRRMVRLLLAACAAAALSAAPAHAYVYWANNGPGFNSDGTTIGRVNLDGSGVNHALVSGLAAPSALVVDSGHIYWVNTQTNSIGRANLDGTGANPAFIPNAASNSNGGGTIPNGLATDGAYLYWTDGEKYVGRATIAGGAVTPHFIDIGGGSFPIGIAVSGGTIYLGTSNAVSDVPAQGGTVKVLTLLSANSNATALAAANGFLYMAEVNISSANASSIARVQLNGSNLNESFVPNLAFPFGVATDGTYVYWSDHGATQNTIGRAQLSTGNAINVQPSFVSEPGGPTGVAVDSGIDRTTTTLTCTATTVATGSPTTCTATVTDSASSAVPTGTVNVTGNGAAFFSGNPCTLTPLPGGGASCVIGAVPTTAGSQALHAAYGGDPIHSPSAGDLTICAGSGCTPTPPPPTPTPTPKPPCVVPKLKGKTLAQARVLLTKGHCALGKVTRPKARKGHKLGKLVVGAQSPGAGRKLTGGSKVSLRLVQAPKPKRKR